ncbi:HNH endonuclease signature motif containing protein [Rhizobium leguminosarum]|uniref:HNH endonuclease n=1 Tax=Rhizobium leguminosarum TaxID=384 RepID=UPI00143F328A|nr:HNH endonuclease [Rhizobium leguminosarum bv. viciae]
MGLAHHDSRWWPVRTAAVRRDDFKCQECGARGRLEVHHVKPVREAPELAYDLGNLKTLCVACHLEKTLAERGQLPSPERKAWQSLLNKGI